MNELKKDKIKKIVICPECKNGSLTVSENKYLCTNCNLDYSLLENTPILLEKKSKLNTFIKSHSSVKNYTLQEKILMSFKTPETRVWSLKSRLTIIKLLASKNPDLPDNIVVNMGAGFEKIFQRTFSKYKQIIKIGIPHIGQVDIIGDAMNLPLKSNSIDLILNSSIIEHLENPEIAIDEIYRTLKPGGKVYVEIPFMRAYHMIPNDFQRYTISGIEKVFERHGFKMIQKGVCSGSFTAFALFLRDFFESITPGVFLSSIVRIFLTYLLHPIKYLDLFFENKKRLENLACNFFYVGKKLN
ncbi:class I SAM-dependent methyltransferase [Candidatus Dependentiae bacterium]|nr:class I SAM-dependent methyltransferase [Candidatus Dependentiae bacterium]